MNEISKDESQPNKPNKYELWQRYQAAKSARAAHADSLVDSGETLTPEQKRMQLILDHTELGALADYQDIAGTSKAPVVSWEEQGAIAAAAMQEMAALKPNDPIAQATAEHVQRDADARQISADIDRQ
jgi:hypothetical protein